MSINCKNCNTQNSDNAKYCIKCGTILLHDDEHCETERIDNRINPNIDKEDFTQRLNYVYPGNNSMPNAGAAASGEKQNRFEQKPNNSNSDVKTQRNKANSAQAIKTVPNSEGVIGTGAYLGFGILFSIPVIGWIACIIMMFLSKSENFKNFSRAAMIRIIIGIVLATVAIIIVAMICGNIAEYANDNGYSIKTADDILSIFSNK